MGDSRAVVRVGVVGCGIGEVHIKAQLKLEQQDPRSELAAVCDTNRNVVLKVSEAFTDLGLDFDAGSGFFTDYDQFLGAVDAVILAVPNDLHALYALAAIDAGKHVLVEKPLAHTLEDATRIAKAAAAHPDLVVSMVMNNIYRRDFAQLMEALRDGMIGEVLEATAWWERGNGIPFRGRWFTQKARSGGGSLIDLGPHLLGLLFEVLGWEEPNMLHGYTWNLFRDGGGNGPYGGGTEAPYAPIDVDTRARALLDINDVLVECRTAWAMHTDRERFGLKLVGTRGTLEWTRLWPTNTGLDSEARDGMWFVSNSYGGMVSRLMNDESPVDQDPLMGRETNSQNFARRCAGDDVPLLTVEQALLVSRTINAWYNSAMNGEEVSLF